MFIHILRGSMWKSLCKGGHPSAERTALCFFDIGLGCIQLCRVNMAAISFIVETVAVIYPGSAPQETDPKRP